MNTNSVVSICITMFLALCAFGCKPEDQSELFGTYLADYDVAKEKLILNADGSFVQEVTLKSTLKTDTAKGTWTYDPSSGYITFGENFMVVLDGFRKLNPDYAHPKPGLVSKPVGRFWRIMMGSAEGILYKKAKQKS